MLPSFVDFVNNFVYFSAAGLVTGIVIASFEIIKRNIDKNNIIGILQNEVKKNINCIISHESNKKVNEFDCRISSEIYKGLLSSGNIKYFETNIHFQLDRLYNQYLIQNIIMRFQKII